MPTICLHIQARHCYKPLRYFIIVDTDMLNMPRSNLNRLRAGTVCLFLTLVSLTLISCGGGGGSDSTVLPPVGGGSSTAPTVSKRLRENFVNEIVVTLFSDLNAAAASLESSITQLRNVRTADNLAAARASWVAARIPWEQSEAALFGPADIFGIDPAIDTWPLSQSELQAVLDSGATFSPSFINSLEDTLKGFHAIEFLIYGNGGTKTVDQITAREADYAVALSAALKQATADLLNGWTQGINGQPAYAHQFLTAGEGSVTFPTEQLATEQVIQGLITIATEVADSKIEEPFAARDADLVESQYSYNSIEDFANNIRGIGLIVDNVLFELLENKSPALLAKVRAQTAAAVNAILAIPQPFSDAIQNSSNDSKITAAQNAIRTLRTTVQTEVLPLAATQNG